MGFQASVKRLVWTDLKLNCEWHGKHMKILNEGGHEIEGTKPFRLTNSNAAAREVNMQRSHSSSTFPPFSRLSRDFRYAICLC